MRPKIVIALLLAGLAGFGGIILLKNLTAPAPVATVPNTQPLEIPAVQQEVKSAPSKISPPAGVINHPAPPEPILPAAQVAANTTSSAAEHEADIQAHIDKLQGLQTKDDAASLQAILSELTNSDKTIRAAAVESAIQFGSRDAIPVLKDLAARTGDAGEKKELLDAADFLALPTLTEIRAQNPGAKIIPPSVQP